MAKERTSYWDSNGKYQAEYDKLWEEFVPLSGESENEYGELIRIVGRLFYEYCNNGNCNAAERPYGGMGGTCNDCDGEGQHENPYYDEDDEDCVEEQYEQCYTCDGHGYTDEGNDLELGEYYEEMLDALALIPELDGYAYKVRALILDDSLHYNYDYSQEEMDVYNDLVDRTVEYVMEKLGRNLVVTK